MPAIYCHSDEQFVIISGILLCTHASFGKNHATPTYFADVQGHVLLH
jgi:hypothetical protein